MRRWWLVGILGIFALSAPARGEDHPIVPAVTTRRYCEALMYHATYIIRLRDRQFSRSSIEEGIYTSPIPRIAGSAEWKLLNALYGSTITEDQAWATWGTPCLKRVRAEPEYKRYLVLELPSR